MLRSVFVAIILLLGVSLGASAADVWKPVKRSPTEQTDNERIDDLRREEVEITVTREEGVRLTLQRPTEVKLVNLLGQIVDRRTLPAGVHRLVLPGRGIYILKAGSVTRRVNI